MTVGRWARGGAALMPSHPIISMASRHNTQTWRHVGNSPTSGSYPVGANTMFAYPVEIETPTEIFKGYWVNGSSAGGNWSVAVYSAEFSKLAETASTAGSGASAPQAAAFASGAIKLSPGLYYVAVAHSSATANRAARWTAGTQYHWRMLGAFQETGITVGSLPATATPALYAGGSVFPCCGLVARSNFDL